MGTRRGAKNGRVREHNIQKEIKVKKVPSKDMHIQTNATPSERHTQRRPKILLSERSLSGTCARDLKFKVEFILDEFIDVPTAP